MVRIKTQDQKLNDAVQKYSDMLYRIAMSLLGKPEDAEDALQNAFLRYYRKSPEFRSENHEKAWLIRCVKMTAKSLYTLRTRHSHDPLEDHIELSSSPIRNVTPEALYSLSANDRLLLQLRYVEGYTNEEIARLLGKSGNAIGKAMERARNRVRRYYEKEENR